MPELMNISALFQKQPPRTTESEELAQAIAAAKARDLHDLNAWDRAMDDLRGSPQCKALLALAMKGDDMEAGWRMIHAIRKQVIATATQHARDVFNGDKTT